MKRKICFVVQRYGSEILGGAEMLAMQYIKHLKNFFEIDVATSCAQDYNTWENVYPPGLTMVDDIEVYRFATEHPRILDKLGPLTEEVYQNPYHDVETGMRWLKEVGPYCPLMLNFIEDCKDYYDAFVFVGYHYYNSTFGMPLVPAKAIFLPTAHDEEPLRKCNYFRTLFHLPRRIIYLTQEEKTFVQNFFRNENIPSVIAGAGINLKCDNVEKKEDLGNPYLVYSGRIDSTKKCDDLFKYFEQYQQKMDKPLQLLLMGEALIEIPKNSNILYLGFVEEFVKEEVLANASAFVMPSENESLSISTLEAMAQGVPVLVNRKSSVLKQHVEKSGGGLCFEDSRSFGSAVDYILQNPKTSSEMGAAGRKYVEKYYNWDTVIRGVKNLIESVFEENEQR